MRPECPILQASQSDAREPRRKTSGESGRDPKMDYPLNHTRTDRRANGEFVIFSK
jgi:hypothetical protein